MAAFRGAERVQEDGMPLYPLLYSVQGFRYCDLLLSIAEPQNGSGLDGLGRSEATVHYRQTCEEIRERGHHMASLPRPASQLLDFALIHLIFGRALLGLALASQSDFTESAQHLERAVQGMRQCVTRWR